MTQIIYNESAVNEGLTYILSHFEHQRQLWPRTISTKTTEGRQVIVYSKHEAIARFKQADLVDCRISAYPYWRPSIVYDFAGTKNAIEPNFTMIDLDLCYFCLNDKVLLAGLRQTLGKIKEILLLRSPSVIWSGNGYHIYIPIDTPVLENIKEFSGLEQVSTKFIRFAEWYLSDGKSDPAHNNSVSLNNCMLRVPGSINSKNNAQVKIVKRFDDRAVPKRPNINLLIGSFYVYIADQQIKETRYKSRIEQSSSFYNNNNNNSNDNSVRWIEKLLQTALPDHRRNCIWKILALYLINVKALSYVESFAILSGWLDKCSTVRRLHFNPNSKIKQDLDGAIKTRYFPISLTKLFSTDKELYNLLHNHGITN